ncbi:chromosome complete related protein [Babesia ovis]|uniref:Chromosome complete related protein n=1 Tax=Babesia ovis TaxID=5869 RepID=A0A9W5TA64_BABOV|nr:chromosome complete related protein [Babesia ovis]
MKLTAGTVNRFWARPVWTAQRRFKHVSSHGVYESEPSKNPWEDTSYHALKKDVGNTGWPILVATNTTQPMWQSYTWGEHSVIPRDGYGCPGTFPPEVSTKITHTFRLPPQFYPFLKKLGDDTPALKPYMDRLITGKFTNQDYEEMFYKFAKPLKIYRKLIPKPFRTAEEQAREAEVSWESAWLSYRQQVAAEYNVAIGMREYLMGMLVALYGAYLWMKMHRQYRADMRLFYHEAPEHKVNHQTANGPLTTIDVHKVLTVNVDDVATRKRVGLFAVRPDRLDVTTESFLTAVHVDRSILANEVDVTLFGKRVPLEVILGVSSAHQSLATPRKGEQHTAVSGLGDYHTELSRRVRSGQHNVSAARMQHVLFAVSVANLANLLSKWTTAVNDRFGLDIKGLASELVMNLGTAYLAIVVLQ